MKPMCRRLGLAILVAGVVVVAVRGVASGRQMPEPPLAPAPTLPEPPRSQLPAGAARPPLPSPSLPALPPANPQPTTPAAPPKSASSINAIVLDVADQPNQANPTGRQEPGVGLEWVC